MKWDLREVAVFSICPHPSSYVTLITAGNISLANGCKAKTSEGSVPFQTNEAGEAAVL